MLSGPGATPAYRLAWAIIHPLFRLLYRMRVIGLHNVPREGPIVLASNHVSNIDPVFVGAACNRQVHFMAKVELWSFRPLGWLVQALGAFPVRRGEADREAIRTALELLDEAAVVGIFPEGRRQMAGKLGEPQPGVALLSMRAGVTTIPVLLRGTDRILRRKRLGFPRVTVRFGPPVPAEAEPGTGVSGTVAEARGDGGRSRAERHREFSGRLMAALQALLDEAEREEAMGGAGRAA